MAKEPRENQGQGRDGRQGREQREPREQRDQRGGGDGEPLQDRVVGIARVAKVVKGGRRFSFSALVVVGDGKDKVGFGLGKAGEVPDAIKKGSEQAKKSMVSVPKKDGTIPFDVVGKYGSASVLMFPAQKGKGIIAGGAVRTIVELAGIQDIICKVHGTKNNQNVVRAAMNGLQQLMAPEQYAKRRDKTLEQVYQARHAEAPAAAGEATAPAGGKAAPAKAAPGSKSKKS